MKEGKKEKTCSKIWKEGERDLYLNRTNKEAPRNVPRRKKGDTPFGKGDRQEGKRRPVGRGAAGNAASGVIFTDRVFPPTIMKGRGKLWQRGRGGCARR